MAKVAASGSLSSNPLHFSGNARKFGAPVKRKTPSELRGEQLKKVNVIEIVDESPAPLLEPMKDSSEVTCGPKKSDSVKNSRYIDTCMDEVYPVRKPREILQLSKLVNGTSFQPRHGYRGRERGRGTGVWKDVDGVLSCDPSIYPYAEPVPYLTFEEAAELAYFGAQATLDESLYELAGELVRFLLRFGREFEQASTDSDKLSPRFIVSFSILSL